MVEVIALFIPISLFAMIVLIVWIAYSSRLKSARVHADMVGKLIEKLGTSQEAMAYLESEAGKKLVESVTAGQRRSNPYHRILGAVGTGIILSAVGLGLLSLTFWFPEEEEAVGFGILALAVGLGFLISAAVSYRLSKSWGLLDGASSQTEGPSVS